MSGPCVPTLEQFEAAGMMRGSVRRAMAPMRTAVAAELVVLTEPKVTKYMPVTNAMV